MYEIAKTVILSGRFELPEMLKKIDTLWIQSAITDEQKNELIELARKNADPAMSNDIIARIEDHEKRLRKLEKTAPVEPPVPGTDPEYPLYQPNHVYYKGDKVTFEGKKYVCKLNEYTDSTTWSPADYPAYWELVE